MILIDAIYINNSGGKVLLDYFVKQLEETGGNIYYLFDSRIAGAYEFIPVYRKRYLDAHTLQRASFYRQSADVFDKVICFGNVPPTRRIKGRVYTLFHNVLLCQVDNLVSWREKQFTALKQNYIFRRLKNTDYVVVQTKNVKKCFLQRFDFDKSKVLVFPFYPEEVGGTVTGIKKGEVFLYVSDGNLYKNHRSLLKAWEEVNCMFPDAQLRLTVSQRYPYLVRSIQECVKKGLNVRNLGFVDQQTLQQHYTEARYLIYPSSTESFGLGIIEGLQHQCEVLAANKPYVHSICQPLDTFDETDPRSIADCVIQQLTSKNNMQYPPVPQSRLLVENKLNDWLQHLGICAD